MDCKLRCEYFSSADALMKWSAVPSSARAKTRPVSTFTAKSGRFCREEGRLLPKTLVCHDMKGGYLEDSFVDGCSDASVFNFTHWNLIDIFVYFSHHFATVPPPCWVHAAHLHGVPILGTLITEWDDGETMCKKIFDSRSTVDELVEKLARVTLHHNFDGWLINIENPIAAAKIPNITYFIRKLKCRLQALGLSNSHIIWYDSITCEGNLAWQNELNDCNRMFFDSCDGIFVNYTWKEENLQHSVRAAGQRLHDVFIGIDVFGRNCYGGGGFGTGSALSVVRKHELSAALFAPGWVHERHSADDYPAVDRRFWASLLPRLSISGVASLPVETSFCPGQGFNRYSYGQVVVAGEWHNMSEQQFQPFLASIDLAAALPPEEGSSGSGMMDAFKCIVQLNLGEQMIVKDDAFHGGGCLRLSSDRPATFPLLVGEMMFVSGFLVALVHKEHGQDQDPGQDLSIVVRIRDKSGVQFSVQCPDAGIGSCENPVSVRIIPSESYQDYDHLLKHPLRPMSEWTTRLFKVDFDGSFEPLTIELINLLSHRSVDCRIGYLAVFQS